MPSDGEDPLKSCTIFTTEVIKSSKSTPCENKSCNISNITTSKHPIGGRSTTVGVNVLSGSVLKFTCTSSRDEADCPLDSVGAEGDFADPVVKRIIIHPNRATGSPSILKTKGISCTDDEHTIGM